MSLQSAEQVSSSGRDPVEPGQTSPTRRRPVWLMVVGLAALVLVVIFVGSRMIGHMSAAPTDLDLSTTTISETGQFRLSYAGETTPIPINQLHTWTLHLETADGEPVDNAEIIVDGDMPQHGHGLPSQPQVTQSLGNGDYLVEGVKFQMGGWWVMDFTISADGQTDTAHFNLLLER
jgi:hypothetical protein